MLWQTGNGEREREAYDVQHRSDSPNRGHCGWLAQRLTRCSYNVLLIAPSLNCVISSCQVDNVSSHDVDVLMVTTITL